jgi:hypothetical protein
VRKAPKDFPEPMNRKKRKLEVLEIAPPPPPKPPTKEEIKAQKMRDHQVLNLLKIQIQPIVDQIHRKYKKFRAPVIPHAQLQYLMDEMDPNFVRPDISQFRPYELDTDKDGVKGLRETASGKFFYNLDTTTIEERLSNGFYARPKDFLADIRSIAKDARHIGDKERTLRANELLSNVEVDIATIEAQPAFADCENVYQRQLQRAKEREEKQKKKAATELAFGAPVVSDIPEGPLMLGEPVPGRAPITVVTPNHSSGLLSNGTSEHHQNGTSTVPRGGADVQMGGMEDHGVQTSQPSQEMHPPGQQLSNIPRGQSNTSAYATGGDTQISQRSGFQEIPHDVSPTAIINDASTTTSGKKTSEGWSTQATNGISSSSPVEKPGADSQLPDTQGNPSQQNNTQPDSGSSEEQWPHSQAHGLARGALVQTYPSQTPSSGSSYSVNPAVLAFNAPSRLTSAGRKPTGFANILNDSPVEPTSSQASSQKDLITCDEYFLDQLLKQLTEGSSGCSVEQLEQINRELMETLWEMRGEYNRNRVAAKLGDVFNETITDIEEMQKVLQASQPSQQHI